MNVEQIKCSGRKLEIKEYEREREEKKEQRGRKKTVKGIKHAISAVDSNKLVCM
jgi:hypothetical protein